MGVLGLLLARRNPRVEVTLIELAAAAARHAAENVRANELAARVRVVRGDLRDAHRFLPPEHFDRAVANPPFRRPGSGAVPSDAERARARHELTSTLDELARAAAALVRFGGHVDLIHLPERLPEICTTLGAHGLEPKRLRLVAPFAGAPPRLCLVSAVKGARPGLRVLPELVLHDARRQPAGSACDARGGKDEKPQPDQ